MQAAKNYITDQPEMHNKEQHQSTVLHYIRAHLSEDKDLWGCREQHMLGVWIASVNQAASPFACLQGHGRAGEKPPDHFVCHHWLLPDNQIQQLQAFLQLDVQQPKDDPTTFHQNHQTWIAEELVFLVLPRNVLELLDWCHEMQHTKTHQQLQHQQ